MHLHHVTRKTYAVKTALLVKKITIVIRQHPVLNVPPVDTHQEDLVQAGVLYAMLELFIMIQMDPHNVSIVQLVRMPAQARQ